MQGLNSGDAKIISSHFSWRQSIIKVAVTVIVFLGISRSLTAFIDNQSADIVVGQPDMQTIAAGTTSQKYDYPYAPFLAGNKLFVADHSNNRVLIYNSIPSANYQAADVVVGQINFTAKLENQGGGPTPTTLYNAQGIWASNNKLIIADFRNNRVLIYNSIPSTNGASADVVIGQPDMYSNQPNQGQLNPADNTLYYPKAVWSDGTKLLIADAMNNRVLIFNNIPTNNNSSADFVIGQADMTTSDSGCSASAIKAPGDVRIYNSKLFLSDPTNNRILIFNSVPTSNGASADLVVGQVDMNHGGINQGMGTGSCTSHSLSSPERFFVGNNKLFIADGGNNRALIYNQLPTANNPAADIVIGQPDMISSAANQGGTADANTMAGISGIFVYNSKLFTTERLNNRLLIYNDQFILTASYPNYVATGQTIKLKLTGMSFIEPFTVRVFANTVDLPILNMAKTTEHLAEVDVNAGSAAPGYYNVQMSAGSQTEQLTQAMLVLKKSIPPLGSAINPVKSLGASALSGTLGSISVGDADNDGENELIVANRNLYLTKIDYLVNGWQSSTLPNGSSGENYVASFVVDGDHDHAKEVFAGSVNNHLYALKSPAWDKTDMGAATDDIICLEAGDGNNDGWVKIYAGTSSGELYQFTKETATSSWQKEMMGTPSGAQEVKAIAWGDADDNQQFEVYTANANGNIYQYTFNGLTWDINSIGSKTSAMVSVAVGDLDGDGQVDVYAANENGQVYEYTKTISSWTETTIAEAPERLSVMKLSDSDNNGKDDLTAGSQEGAVYKIKYENSSWHADKIADTQSNIISEAIGDGDNDYQNEVYLLDDQNNIYEIQTLDQVAPTPTPTPTATVTPTPINLEGFDGQLISKKFVYTAPNPVRGNNANFTVYVKAACTLEVQVYTTSHQKVMTFNLECPTAGFHHKQVYMGNLANGVYLFLVKAKDEYGKSERVIKKIALIK